MLLLTLENGKLVKEKKWKTHFDTTLILLVICYCYFSFTEKLREV